MKLVVSSLESVMQDTERDINAIHHTIDSCRINYSNSEPKGYLEKSVSLHQVAVFRQCCSTIQ